MMRESRPCHAADLAEIESLPVSALIAQLRRKSSGFSRGASHFRGVTRHHQQGRWEARIGRVLGEEWRNVFGERGYIVYALREQHTHSGA